MSFKDLIEKFVSSVSDIISSPGAEKSIKNADKTAEKANNTTVNCHNCKRAKEYLNMQQAQKLHSEMASQSDIPFNYAPDCCYARAEKMSQLMTAKDIPNKKTWAYGSLKPKKENGQPVADPNGKPITWGWHVAPTVPVQMSSGEIVDMVIDPSLRDRPLTIPEWEGTMGTVSLSAQTDKTVYLRDRMGRQLTHTDAQNPYKIETAFKRHRRNLRNGRQ